MNDLTSNEHWSELQGKLRQKYPELSDTDLEFEETRGQDMLRIVEYKLHKTKEEMQEIITRI